MEEQIVRIAGMRAITLPPLSSGVKGVTIRNDGGEPITIETSSHDRYRMHWDLEYGARWSGVVRRPRGSMNRTLRGIGYAIGAAALGTVAVVSLTTTTDPSWVTGVVAAAVGIAVFFAPSIQTFFRDRT